MKAFAKMVWDRFTKCDSGLTLNPLMHLFLLITLVFSVSFLFFGDTQAVQAAVLYQQTQMVGQTAVHTWGIIGFFVMILHTVAFWVRGRTGSRMMFVCVFGGFYLWLWAGIVYLTAGFVLQFFVTCFPNLMFWTWYAVEWRKRRRGDRVAFV